MQEDFEAYYSSAPAQDFAARVFTNNAYIAAQAIVFGVLLGLPVLYVLISNAVNVGIAGGLMAANDRTGLFFGLILPHGLLELTAVFVACGLGLKLGWTVVDPGRRTRSRALAEEGRALVAGALGLALVLGTAGLPHILIRFYTVPDSKAARKSVNWGIGLIGTFYLFTLILGFGAAALAVTTRSAGAFACGSHLGTPP